MTRYFNPILIIGLIATVVYLGWFKKPNINYTAVTTNNTVQTPEPPIRRLSGFVDAHLDAIFTPLDDTKTILPKADLAQIRATLVDLSSTKNERDKKLYLSGIALCTSMLNAIGVRESYTRRLADSRSKKPVSMESDGERRQDEIERKWKFFYSGIQRSWESESTTIRYEISKQYDYMRLLER